MLLLVLSAVGLLVGPEPDPKRMINPNDFPTEMLRARKSVSAEVEAIISPKGQMESCTLISFVGDKQFAKQVCGILDKRMWRASLDVQGSPVFGQIRTSIKLTIPGTAMGNEAERAEARPDYEFPFPSSWSGTEDIDVPLAVLVAADGHVEACNFQPAPLTKKKARELSDAACQGAAQKSYGPLVTPEGPIQRYVTMQTVRFTKAKP